MPTVQTQTLLVTPGATATMLSSHVVIDVGLGEKKQLSPDIIDPIMVSVLDLCPSLLLRKCFSYRPPYSVIVL